MDKILSQELSFKHIFPTNEGKKVKTTGPYFNELIQRLNIINHEFYDYIIFNCGYKDSSNEYKKEITAHLDDVMINFLKKLK